MFEFDVLDDFQSADADAGVVAVGGVGVFGVGGDFDSVAGAEDELVAGNIKKHFACGYDSDFAEGLSVLFDLCLRSVGLLEGFEALGF